VPREYLFGTYPDHLIVTSLYDDAADNQDTNNGGRAPQRGDWDTIQAVESGELDLPWTAIRYGGGTPGIGGALSSSTTYLGHVSLDHTEIANSGQRGVLMWTTAITIEHSQILSNTLDGIWLSGVKDLHLAGNTFAGNQGAAVQLQFTGNKFFPSFDVNTAQNNGIDGIAVTGSVDDFALFSPKAGLPFVVPANARLVILASGTVDLYRGTTLELGAMAGVDVYGNFKTIDDPLNPAPAVITSLGDTPDVIWDAIRVYAAGSVFFPNTQVRYGGWVNGMIVAESGFHGSIDIIDSELRDSAKDGLVVFSIGTIHLQTSAFRHNTRYAIANYTSTALDVSGNTWEPWPTDLAAENDIYGPVTCELWICGSL